MRATILQSSAWKLAERQHGVIARQQLLALGFSAKAIRHRIAKGRLFPVARGVYAVGRPELSQKGRWMAAVLSCGPEAVLSHQSAAELWEIRPARGKTIEVSVPAYVNRSRPGVTLHRRAILASTRHHGIPVTTPADTLIDLGAMATRAELEAAVNHADQRDLIGPDTLRAAAEQAGRRTGARALRRTLDPATFTLTDSELERAFLPIARRAGLPKPETQARVNGYRVDFSWPELGLVVETDGLRYHRTPTQQARDALRDQTHTANGLTSLRFTHHQIKHERDAVRAVLAAVVARLGRDALQSA